jgi:membrane fusion protein, copper/silver efflux system
MNSRKKGILAAVLVVLLVIGGLVFWQGRHAGHDQVAGAGQAKVQYTCGMHPFIIQDEPGLCPICGMKLTPMRGDAAPGATAERKIRHWVSPMDPTYIRDEPGQDYMGHDMVPVYEDGVAAGQILIDPVTIQNMGLRTAMVERRDVTRTIRTIGRIDYDENRRFMVNSKIDGWIERLHVRETGREVRRGQPLLEIYSPELVAAQQEYLLALSNRDRLAGNQISGIAGGAERLLEAARTRLQFWDISERQIAELEKTRQVRKTLTLHAPFSGVVTEKEAFEGMAIMSGMNLFRIADLSRVWVLAEVYEVDLAWLRSGQEAIVELPYAPGRKFPARIDYVYPYFQGETRTQQVRLELANPQLELKPEMYVNVHLEASTLRDVPAVPVQAVLYSGIGQRVFVHLGEGRFEPRPVQVGLLGDDGWIEVTSGVREGEIVVTSAQFMLDSESRLQEAVQKMLQPKVQEPPPAHDHDDEDLEDLFK